MSKETSILSKHLKVTLMLRSIPFNRSFLRYPNMFLFLILSFSVYSSSNTEQSYSSWIARLNPESDIYVSELYCGTVARGVSYLTDAREPVDIEGFRQGLTKIIHLYQIRQTPMLNKIEVKWLMGQLSYVWKADGLWKGRKPFFKYYKALRLMQKTSDRSISYASLLADAKDHYRILNPKEKTQAIAFIQSESNVSDPLCQQLHKDLLKSIDNRSFIIPYYDSEKEIEAAINEGINYFSKKMKDREITVLGYYLYAQISQMMDLTSAKDSGIHNIRAEATFKMLVKQLSPVFFLGKKAMAIPRIVMGILKQRFFSSDSNISIKFTDYEATRIKNAIASQFFQSDNISNSSGSGRFKIFELIAAQVLGMNTSHIMQSYPELFKDTDWINLCPDMKIVVGRLKKKLEVLSKFEIINANTKGTFA
jgi:hypothetical protein